MAIPREDLREDAARIHTERMNCYSQISNIRDSIVKAKQSVNKLKSLSAEIKSDVRKVPKYNSSVTTLTKAIDAIDLNALQTQAVKIISLLDTVATISSKLKSEIR